MTDEEYRIHVLESVTGRSSFLNGGKRGRLHMYECVDDDTLYFIMYPGDSFRQPQNKSLVADLGDLRVYKQVPK